MAVVLGRADDSAQLALRENISYKFLPTYRPLFATSPVIPGTKLAKELVLKNNVALTDRPDTVVLPAGTGVTLDESSTSERLIRVRWQSHELCLPRSSIESKQ